MNGAESLVRTLHNGGVDVCFANPGTSEMHFVDALDRTGLMRCVLGLAETVVTGAADGYYRMAGKPACTLLHLAPGVTNAGANLHNAKKARSGIVNIVGEHARQHLAYDAPLSADVAGASEVVSDWVRTSRGSATLGTDAAEALAVAKSHPGKIATLIAPADLTWSAGGVVAEQAPEEAIPTVGDAVIDKAAALLDSDGNSAIILSGRVLGDVAALKALARVAAATGARLLSPTSNRRAERGAGIPDVTRIPYVVEKSLELLGDLDNAIFVEAPAPVGFFAYPNLPSELLPPGCRELTLAGFGEDGSDAVIRLADHINAPAYRARRRKAPAAPGSVPINARSLGMALGAALPEGAVVVDESITLGRDVYGNCATAAPHSWLSLTGGAIGAGLPMATGAALGAPDRPVVNLQADGSAMYSIQALWTQARENLDVTTVILANQDYAILKGELTKVGANPGRSALDMLEIGRPPLSFVKLAEGLGVSAERVSDAASLSRAIRESMDRPGPHLIEAMVDQ
ncbi:MAG: acetolactate synthase large subunit [Pseudomonadota bacterium]